MVEIINLRKRRKQAQRERSSKIAADNRVQHGTPKRLREFRRAEDDKAGRDLDQHKLESGGSE
jgi:hypothetical protein